MLLEPLAPAHSAHSALLARLDADGLRTSVLVDYPLDPARPRDPHLFSAPALPHEYLYGPHERKLGVAKYVLVSNYLSMAALPLLTEPLYYDGCSHPEIDQFNHANLDEFQIFATEPTVILARNLMLEMIDSYRCYPDSNLINPKCIYFNGHYRSFYSKSQLSSCLKKIKLLKYNQPYVLDDSGYIIEAKSSGYVMGSCNWIIRSECSNINNIIISDSKIYNHGLTNRPLSDSINYCKEFDFSIFNQLSNNLIFKSRVPIKLNHLQNSNSFNVFEKLDLYNQNDNQNDNDNDNDTQDEEDINEIKEYNKLFDEIQKCLTLPDLMGNNIIIPIDISNDLIYNIIENLTKRFVINKNQNNNYKYTIHIIGKESQNLYKNYNILGEWMNFHKKQELNYGHKPLFGNNILFNNHTIYFHENIHHYLQQFNDLPIRLNHNYNLQDNKDNYIKNYFMENGLHNNHRNKDKINRIIFMNISTFQSKNLKELLNRMNKINENNTLIITNPNLLLKTFIPNENIFNKDKDLLKNEFLSSKSFSEYYLKHICNQYLHLNIIELNFYNINKSSNNKIIKLFYNHLNKINKKTNKLKFNLPTIEIENNNVLEYKDINEYEQIVYQDNKIYKFNSIVLYNNEFLDLLPFNQLLDIYLYRYYLLKLHLNETIPLSQLENYKLIKEKFDTYKYNNSLYNGDGIQLSKDLLRFKNQIIDKENNNMKKYLLEDSNPFINIFYNIINDYKINQDSKIINDFYKNNNIIFKHDNLEYNIIRMNREIHIKSSKMIRTIKIEKLNNNKKEMITNVNIKKGSIQNNKQNYITFIENELLNELSNNVNINMKPYNDIMNNSNSNSEITQLHKNKELKRRNNQYLFKIINNNDLEKYI